MVKMLLSLSNKLLLHGDKSLVPWDVDDDGNGIARKKLFGWQKISR
jgi:hypothetical protein